MLIISVYRLPSCTKLNMASSRIVSLRDNSYARETRNDEGVIVELSHWKNGTKHGIEEDRNDKGVVTYLAH